jgi:membrane protease YdiL (CAAX protease family)
MFAYLTDSAKACQFFVVAFGLTVTVSLLYPLLGEITPLIHMFTPLLSVLIMMLVVTREGYTKAGWATLGLHRAGLRWWVLALLGPLIMMSAIYGIVWSTGVAQAVVPAGWFTPPALASMFGSGLGLSCALALGEEIGFRGYLLPRLMQLGTTRALLLSGLLHAIWHLPLMLLTPFIPFLGNWLIIVPVFVLTLTTAGVFYGYLQLRSRSVWSATLAHGAINWFLALFAALTVTAWPLALSYLAGETGILTLITTAIAAGWLLYRLGQGRRTATSGARHLSKRTPKEKPRSERSCS